MCFEPLDPPFVGADQLSFLDFSQDRILSFMPGTLAGASSFDKMARNVIFESKSLGLNVEVWSLDRRANCLDDNRGVLAGLASENYQDTLDYYYHGKSIDGSKFEGFYSNGDKKLKFLSEVGVDQTSKDWHAVIDREIPDAAYRATKVSRVNEK